MTWKKDLAKLKQALDKDEAPPARTPPPKAKPAEGGPKTMEEEDQVFLSAMGVRARPAKAAATPRPQAAPAPLPPPPPAASAGGEFTSAMGDLKGVKPMRPAGVKAAAPAPQPAPPAAPIPAEPPTSGSPASGLPASGLPASGLPASGLPASGLPASGLPASGLPASGLPASGPDSVPEPAAPAAPPQALIQLAAGMAVVVDGSLDLKGHGRNDAEERLKERLLDGYALGWRTLHVVVGTSPELRQMVLDLLASPAGRCVARYAQAPVPMGGPQAWILYFGTQSSSEN